MQMVLDGFVGYPLIKMAGEGDDEYFGSLVASAIKLFVVSVSAIFVVTLIVFLITWGVTGDDFYLIMAFLPVIHLLIALPVSFGYWVNTSKIKFQNVSIIGILGGGGLLLTGALSYWLDLSLVNTLLVFTAGKIFQVVAMTILGWNYIGWYRKFKVKYVRKLVDFGKYSMGTMLGSSGLSNSDTFILMAFLGPEAVAIYSVPFRIIGLYDIPLRALTQIAFPSLAQAREKFSNSIFRKEFEKQNGFSFLVLLPLSILIFVFAEELVTLVGGVEYVSSASILRVFSVYLMITPLDRFGGMALDIVNKPNMNFVKMMLMLSFNIVGDLVVVLLGGGVLHVALVSIFTFLLGGGLSYYYLRKDVPFRPLRIVRHGMVEITYSLEKLGLKKVKS